MAIYILAWFVIVMPLIGAGATFLAETQRRAAQVALGFSVLSFVLAAIVVGVRLRTATQAPYESLIAFFSMNPPESSVFASRFQPQLGVHVDSLTATIGVIFAFVGVAVQGYARHALRGDESYRRFFWTSSLMSFAVLGIAYSPSLFQFLLMAAAASVATYLLALHWWQRTDAAAPARRALVTLSIADVAALLATAFLFVKFGLFTAQQPSPGGQDIFDPFSFATLPQLVLAAQHGLVAGVGTRTIEVLSIVLFFTALVRSAQAPFHVWFTELTSAPVAVAAIALSTAGASGAYLLVRVYPLLLAAPHLLSAVAVLGAITAVLCTVISLAQRDLLRIGALVASALLGMSFAALGSGGFGAGLFVLVVSVLSTTLFFVAAGNLARVYRTRNIHEMGGAWTRMRFTSVALGAWALAVGGLALDTYYALAATFSGQLPGGGHMGAAPRALVIALLVAAAALLAITAMRAVLTVCTGEMVRRRGLRPERVTEVDPRTARWVWLSMLALGVAVLFGLPGVGTGFTHFVSFPAIAKPAGVDGLALLVSLALLAAGAAAAVGLFAPSRRQRVSTEVERFQPAVRVVARGFFVERVAHRVGQPFVLAGDFIARFDEVVADRFADAVDQSGLLVADLAARTRSSRLNLYVAGGAAVAGIVTVLSVLAATGHLGGVTL